MRRAMFGIAIGLVCGACSGADDHPLGGPYGGTTNVAQPGSSGSQGANQNNAGGSTSSGSGSSSGGDPGSSSGSTSSSSGGGSSSSSSSSSGGSSGASSSSSSSSSGGTAAPTWTQVWTSYLKGGTVGNCSHCHSQTASASGAYSWLKNKGQIGGSKPALTDTAQSCLTWYGGNMPTNGPSQVANAVNDMNAWAAAGAQNN